MRLKGRNGSISDQRDVKRDEDRGEDSDEAVHVLDREHRPASRADAVGERQAEDDEEGEEQVGRRSRPPARRTRWPRCVSRITQPLGLRREPAAPTPPCTVAVPSSREEPPREALWPRARRAQSLTQEEGGLCGDVRREAGRAGDGDARPR